MELYTSNTSIVSIYDHTKTIVDNQSVKLKPINISGIHFEGKLPNFLTIQYDVAESTKQS